MKKSTENLNTLVEQKGKRVGHLLKIGDSVSKKFKKYGHPNLITLMDRYLSFLCSSGYREFIFVVWSGHSAFRMTLSVLYQ